MAHPPLAAEPPESPWGGRGERVPLGALRVTARRQRFDLDLTAGALVVIADVERQVGGLVSLSQCSVPDGGSMDEAALEPLLSRLRQAGGRYPFGTVKCLATTAAHADAVTQALLARGLRPTVLHIVPPSRVQVLPRIGRVRAVPIAASRPAPTRDLRPPPATRSHS